MIVSGEKKRVLEAKLLQHYSCRLDSNTSQTLFHVDSGVKKIYVSLKEKQRLSHGLVTNDNAHSNNLEDKTSIE